MPIGTFKDLCEKKFWSLPNRKTAVYQSLTVSARVLTVTRHEFLTTRADAQTNERTKP